MTMGIGAGIADVSYQTTANAVNTAVTAYSNRKQREFTREMSDLAWQRDQEMWNMQNKYNSPAAQMQRFRDAGLNPRLIYGRGNEGNATAYPKYQAPYGQFSTNKIDTRLGLTDMYNDIRMKDAQIDLVNEQKKNVIQTTRINSAKAKLTEAMAKITDQTVQNKLNRYAYENNGFQYDLNAKKLKNSKLSAEIMQTAQKMDLTELEIQRLQKWLSAMELGVNIDRDPWYIRVIERIVRDIQQNGFSDATEDMF